jgi:hypothetical protein
MYRHRRALFVRSCRVEVNHSGHLVAGNQRLPNGEDARRTVGIVVQIRPADTDIADP